MKKKVYKGHRKFILPLVMLVIGLLVGALVIPLRAANQDDTDIKGLRHIVDDILTRLGTGTGGEGEMTTIKFQGSYVLPNDNDCNNSETRGALYFYKVADGVAGDDILFLCKQKIVDQPTGQSDYVWVAVSN